MMNGPGCQMTARAAESRDAPMLFQTDPSPCLRVAARAPRFAFFVQLP